MNRALAGLALLGLCASAQAQEAGVVMTFEARFFGAANAEFSGNVLHFESNSVHQGVLDLDNGAPTDLMVVVRIASKTPIGGTVRFTAEEWGKGTRPVLRSSQTRSVPQLLQRREAAYLAFWAQEVNCADTMLTVELDADNGVRIAKSRSLFVMCNYTHE